MATWWPLCSSGKSLGDSPIEKMTTELFWSAVRMQSSLSFADQQKKLTDRLLLPVSDAKLRSIDLDEVLRTMRAGSQTLNHENHGAETWR